MADRDLPLDDFFRADTSRELLLDEYLRHCISRAEVRAAIQHLIEHRQELRDSEIARLEAEASRVLERLAQLSQQQALEEISHFRDILQMHRRLLEENES